GLGEGSEYLAIRDRPPARARPGPQHLENTGFPVDERAVAVELEDPEVRELHRPVPSPEATRSVAMMRKPCPRGNVATGGNRAAFTPNSRSAAFPPTQCF